MAVTPIDPQDQRSSAGPAPLDYATPSAVSRGEISSAIAVVCGVMFFPVLCAAGRTPLFGRQLIVQVVVLLSMPVTAVALGWFARAARSGVAASARRRAGAGLLLGWLEISLIILFASATRSNSGHDPAFAYRLRCGSNLRMIGQGVLIYSAVNKGRFPPDLDAVMLTQDLTFDALVCPSTNDAKALGATTQAALQQMHAQTGHCSYIYVGQGLTDRTVTPVHVIAYEPTPNHTRGVNVLYGDGHVEFLKPADSTYVLNELKAGQNPPRTRWMEPTPAR